MKTILFLHIQGTTINYVYFTIRLCQQPMSRARPLPGWVPTVTGAQLPWSSKMIAAVFRYTDCLTMVFPLWADSLQIENPNRPGEFIDVPPIKDAVVMNVGDLMMRWSNGRRW